MPKSKLTPAAQALAERLQSKATALGAKRNPSTATKLIDRLRDTQLNGHWVKAVALFDNYPVESRQWRWQSFHYRCLIQVLAAAKQPVPLRRVWESMMLRPELAVEPEGANDALALATHGSDDALVEEIKKTIDERGFGLKQRALAALERRRAADWVTALADVAHRVELLRHEQPEASAPPAALADELNSLAGRNSRNPDAVRAIVALMAAAGVPQTSEAYAARIRSCGKDWAAALAIMAECREAGRTRPPTTS